MSATTFVMDDQRSRNSEEAHHAHVNELTKHQAYYLFMSHTLSMWNSRMFEFGVILFIQASFPGNLTASSINGIAETVCVLFFGSTLGRWVDRTPSRLRVLLVTIIVNRISVLVSCITWFVILSSTYPASKQGFFAVALVLGMAEKLSRGANILSIERDWVPTLANTSPDAKHPAPYDLTNLNTTMKRIDMLCKLIAPLAVSTFVSRIKSERIAVIVLAVISTLSFGPECWGVQQLCCTRTPLARLASPLYGRLIFQVMSSIREYVSDLGYYFRTSVWIPSLCAAVPHASVLTFSGTMLTYLLNAGFSLNTITGARASGAVFEISSTFIFPWAVGILSTLDHAPRWCNRRDYRLVEQQEPSSGSYTRLGDTDENDLQRNQSGFIIEHSVIQVGYWSLGGLLLSLIPAVFSLFILDVRLRTPPSSTSSPNKSPIASHPLNTIILILSISLSLLFRWTYDLCATQLTQTLVPAPKRSSFGGTEMSIVSMISLGHWIAAAVWHTQGDFKWLALGSFVLVAIGVGAFGWWRRWWERRESASEEQMQEALETDSVM